MRRTRSPDATAHWPQGLTCAPAAWNARRFHLGSDSFLMCGQSASRRRFGREREAEGQLVLVVERGGRYLTYLHDPAADDEADDAGADS